MKEWFLLNLWWEQRKEQKLLALCISVNLWLLQLP